MNYTEWYFQMRYYSGMVFLVILGICVALIPIMVAFENFKSKKREKRKQDEEQRKKDYIDKFGIEKYNKLIRKQ